MNNHSVPVILFSKNGVPSKKWLVQLVIQIIVQVLFLKKTGTVIHGLLPVLSHKIPDVYTWIEIIKKKLITSTASSSIFLSKGGIFKNQECVAMKNTIATGIVWSHSDDSGTSTITHHCFFTIVSHMHAGESKSYLGFTFPYPLKGA